MDIVDSLQTGITSFFDELFGFLPALIGFLAILLIGWWVARLLSQLVARLFKAINLDHYLDRAGIGGPLERAGYADSGRFVAKLFYYLLMLLVLKLAFGALDIDALNEPFDQLIAWIPKAIVALTLIVIGGIVANVVRDLVRGVTAGQSYTNLVTNAAGIGVWVIFGLAALDQAGIAADVIDTAQLKTLQQQDPDIRILDVRSGGEFETVHIPGSYNVPLDTLGMRDAILALPEQIEGSLTAVDAIPATSEARVSAQRLVERLPARELFPDSDLGMRPVTVGVGRLDAASCEVESGR